MRILLLGSGGREHALAYKISQSDSKPDLFCLPGNPGIAEVAEIVEISTDFETIKKFILVKEIDLLVVGPEAPLVEGIVDYFEKQLPDLKVVGPDKHAAQLEGSKSFAKSFMDKYNIPTASYKVFNTKDIEDAISYLDTKEAPYVLKADGLAAGKGVLICNTRHEAASELRAMLQQAKFGQAGEKVVIESFLKGIEFSVFVLTDGKNYKILPEAKDYKRAFENDEGLNTGGMGAVSPVPFVTSQLMDKVVEKIVEPTVKGIQHEKMNYKGFLYFGLMLVNDEPFVIEYNVRMGDPETQSVMLRLDEDLLKLLDETAKGILKTGKVKMLDKYCVTKVLASAGYPESYKKGKVIDFSNLAPGDIVFHAGTKKEKQSILTNGGRVLAVCALSNTLSDAMIATDKLAEKIKFEGKFFRKDIGKDLMEFLIDT